MNRLKELREERKWSMREAAKFVGKPYTTYVNHEKGLRGLDDVLLKEYASAYNVSVDYLVGRTDIKTPVTNNDDGYDIKADKAMRIFRSLDEATKDMVLAQLEGLEHHRANQDDQ